MQVVVVFQPNFSHSLPSSPHALDRKLDTLGDLVVGRVYELLHNCIHIRMYYATVSSNDVASTNGIIYSLVDRQNTGFKFNAAWDGYWLLRVGGTFFLTAVT